MDLDSFIGTPRWRILEILSKKPSSPLEISGILSTSVAYVSQQLKLLEASGLITKFRTRLVDKGQPRTLFSIAQDLVFITALMKDNSGKKMIALDDYHKTILRIWLLEDNSLHYYLEKFYWKIESEISTIDLILIDTKDKAKLYIFSDSKKLSLKIDSLVKETENRFSIHILPEEDIKKFSDKEFLVLYDSGDALKIQMKGGNEK